MSNVFWMVQGHDLTSYKYTSYESAELEAKRLAGEFPDETFYVLEAITAHTKSEVASWALGSPGVMSPRNRGKEYGIPW